MPLIEDIKKAQNIVLSTHKNSDGDGLGSEMSMYFALKKLGKTVYFFHSDLVPARYHFLMEKIPTDLFLTETALQEVSADLVLIFDTHDPRLCAPLYNHMVDKRTPIYFIDHHVTTDYSLKNSQNHIDENASCTGEIVLDIIKKLEISLDPTMASALFASLIFDTQNFKFIRDYQRPFLMASELLETGIDYDKIQQQLFAHWSIEKMNYLAHLISNIVYKNNKTIALIKITSKDLAAFNIESDQVSDLIDFFMQIKSLEMSIVIREESPNYHKLSFRSRSNSKALTWAESFGGGGHAKSSGAWVDGSMAAIAQQLDQLIDSVIDSTKSEIA